MVNRHRTADTPNLAAQGQSVSRKTVAEVPLTGLSFKWVNEVGNVRSKWNYVFGYAYQIPAGKTLASVKLPNNSNNLGILGMAML